MIAWKVYRLAQISAGRRQPITIREPVEGQPRFMDNEMSEEIKRWTSSDLNACRVAHVFIFNQSDSPQTLTLSDIKIKGPRLKDFSLYYCGQSIELPPQAGGNLPIYFQNSEWLNLSDEELSELLVEWHPQKCLLYIYAQTLSGQKTPFKGKSNLIWPHDSP